MAVFRRLLAALKWALGFVLYVPRSIRRAWLRARIPDRAETITANPAVERRLAVLNVVSQRCGLCRNFSRSDWEGVLKQERAFAQATALLEPWQMARAKGEANPAPTMSSDATLELRPDLRERWEDYGICRLHQVGVWGFAEQPRLPDPDSEPCEAWR